MTTDKELADARAEYDNAREDTMTYMDNIHVELRAAIDLAKKNVRERHDNHLRNLFAIEDQAGKKWRALHSDFHYDNRKGEVNGWVRTPTESSLKT